MAGCQDSLRTTSEPTGSYELYARQPYLSREELRNSYQLVDSDVIRELSHEPAMFYFYIGLMGEVLKQLRLFAASTEASGNVGRKSIEREAPMNDLRLC